MAATYGLTRSLACNPIRLNVPLQLFLLGRLLANEGTQCEQIYIAGAIGPAGLTGNSSYYTCCRLYCLSDLYCIALSDLLQHMHTTFPATIAYLTTAWVVGLTGTTGVTGSTGKTGMTSMGKS